MRLSHLLPCHIASQRNAAVMKRINAAVMKRTKVLNSIIQHPHTKNVQYSLHNIIRFLKIKVPPKIF